MADNTPIEIRRCSHCNTPVLTALVAGHRAVADPATLTIDQYRTALITGRPVYRIKTGAGNKPRYLFDDSPHQHTSLPQVGAHACRTGTKPLRPQAQANVSVCATWEAAGWSPPQSCPRRRTGPLRADSCDTCQPPPF